MEDRKNESPPPGPQPKYPLRRSLLKLGASLLGIAALNKTLPPKITSAEAPAPPPQAPVPDKESVLRDLIPRAELKSRYNIEILDLPDVPKPVTLNFLRSAEEHRVFKQLLEFKERDDANVFVVLLDGPYVDPQFLTPKQLKTLPEEAVSKLKQACNELVEDKKNDYQRTKKNKLMRYDEDLAFLQHDLDTGKINQDRYFLEVQALERMYLEPTREDILEKTRAANFTPEIDNTENRYIFMPVRNVSDKTYEYGSEKTTSPSPPNKHGYPTPGQSYPNPSRFILDPNNKMYPLDEGSTPAVDLRHEFEHIIGTKHPYADLFVVNDLTESYEQAIKGNPKGHWLVWETEEGLTVSQTKTQNYSA